MTAEAWVLATDEHKLAAVVATVRAMAADIGVTVVAVGPRSVADAAAAAGPDRVTWIETTDDIPAEAYAGAVGRLVSAAGPRVVLATTAPAARSLLGAAAAALDAVVVPGVAALTLDGDRVVVGRTDLGGRVVETLASTVAVAGLFGGADVAPAAATPAPVERLLIDDPSDVRLEKSETVRGAGTGIAGAQRVVAVGRGLNGRADLAVIEELAEALGAAVGCSMPIADDFGWLPKDRYVGRSGQQISPRLYVAIGISGAPQHLDGVRDAKTVVAVNSDPDAPIFRRADYGIVGDLYEVVPELRAALAEVQS